jgi:hypothetical protein
MVTGSFVFTNPFRLLLAQSTFAGVIHERVLWILATAYGNGIIYYNGIWQLSYDILFRRLSAIPSVHYNGFGICFTTPPFCPLLAIFWFTVMVIGSFVFTNLFAGVIHDRVLWILATVYGNGIIYYNGIWQLSYDICLRRLSAIPSVHYNGFGICFTTPPIFALCRPSFSPLVGKSHFTNVIHKRLWWILAPSP